MMAPAPTAALAVPFFLMALVASAGATSSKPAPTPIHGRRLRLKPAVALADISGHSEKRTKTKNPLPSGWFGDFSQEESTYTTEGLDSSREDPSWAVQYGRDPSLVSPYTNTEVYKAKWFHESESGGPTAAWQTNYPSLTDSIAGNRDTPENPWRETPQGWVQDYRPAALVGPSRADWFDNSVRQIDGFSRKMQPGVEDGERYVDWKERSVNTTLSCKDVGCIANSSLQLFNAVTEEAKLCTLSIDIHPTDYDDDFSLEHVEYWKVNGYIATRECNPRARGCNSTAEKPLYPCLSGFNVDRVVNSGGTLVIEGKNSPAVDECPYNDNLLSGVAMATCMVRNKTDNPMLVQGSKNASAPNQTVQWQPTDLHGEAALKCNKPGCKAESLIYLSPAIALNGGRCTMNVTVRQTDFNLASEQIEFIQVEGQNATPAAGGSWPKQPGQNPCISAYKNQSLLQTDMVYEAVKSFDVTSMMRDSHPLGVLKVTGKISESVDECGYEGNLLSGNVTVDCVPPATFSAPPPASLLGALHAPTPDVTPVLLQRSLHQHRSK